MLSSRTGKREGTEWWNIQDAGSESHMRAAVVACPSQRWPG